MFENEINSIIKNVADKCNPKAIIVFGSIAKGTSTEVSDIDIMVILDTDLTYYERTLVVRRAIGVTSIPVDILAFTPDEIEEGKQKKGSIISEALTTGRVVYGAA